MQLVKLQRHFTEVEATGAAVFAVSIDRPDVAREMRRDMGLTFPILFVPDMQVIRALGMKGEGMDMGDMGYVIIDKRGLIRERKVDRNFGDNARQIIDLLEKVQREA